ncbi:MAG TPA: FecR domain-containing protein [Phenylobacterium sp.]|uniref:FecR family protein n=1 Tax=Phenylobacterium sp. TaxID=1871053 RepID=UPI002B488C37|nr:FecR domain-containing protein [Phenylobacterium sp.]HKR90143.1 FecR domain-containing protein [Phenylobacterium sp.]
MRPSIDTEAARWALMLRDPDTSPEDILEALAWIDATPESEAAFNRADRFLLACDSARSDPSHDAMFPGPAAKVGVGASPGDRRGWFPVAAVAASIALVFAAVTALLTGQFSWRPDEPIAQARYASRVGEIRSVSLPDGSSVKLAGGSAISISFNRKSRQVALTRGEALFAVAHNQRRPFVVTTDSGSATAVGTAFNVHRDIGGTTVTVVRGVVDVVSEGARSEIRTRLGQAMQVSYFRNGGMGPVRQVELPVVLGWERNKLNFFEQPLAAVVADLNRYSPKPIVIEDSEIGLMPITGSVNTDGIVEWLNGLASIGRVEVIQDPAVIKLKARHQPLRRASVSPRANTTAGA